VCTGVQGYVDDRRADAPGWFSFDVSKVSCPVTICHGEADTIVPVLAAHHTHSLLPQSELRLFAPLGHLSIGGEALKAAGDLAKAHA
jgi:pimeloyl-ACP methyl ester carboxylesterase